MTPYLLITAAIAVAAILFPQRRPSPFMWGLAYVVIVVFVGLRHKVGMDWNNYLLMINRVAVGSLWDSFDYAEPAYAALLWASAKLDAGVYGANLVGAALFCSGLFRFARTTPSPWLAITTAMPVLVIVVAMSANRQSIAIGVLLWLVAVWHKSSVVTRILFILSAAMFHFSAAFFLVFVAFDLKIRRSYKLVVGVLGVAAMIGFLQYTGSVTRYDSLYISGQTDMTFSPGAYLHVLLNGLPAALLLIWPSEKSKLFPSLLYIQMALFALVLIPLSFVTSAAAGRMTLYLFPVSMYVFSVLPKVMRETSSRELVRISLASVFVGLTWFWLAYANSRHAHIPYMNALTMEAWELHL